MFSVSTPHAFKAVSTRIKFNLGLSKFISTLGLVNELRSSFQSSWKVLLSSTYQNK